jgi:glycosidase
MLNFTKELLHLRRGHAALRIGRLANLQVDGNVRSFERVAQDDRVGVAVNFAKSPTKIPWDQQLIRHSFGSMTSDGELPPGGALWVEFL